MKSKIYMLVGTAALAVAALGFVSAATLPGTGPDSHTVNAQVAPSPQFVPPSGSQVIIRGNTYRVVDIDSVARTVLYEGDSEADAVAAANTAMTAGVRVAYDTIQRITVDPTP